MQLKVTNIIDLHTCIQGEGKFAGIPHILIRVSGCNLRCQFRDNICDTPYSSWFPEKGKYEVQDIENIYISNPQIKHTFITGGEPFLDAPNTEKLIKIARGFNQFIAVETNGSLYAHLDFDFVTISPKLSNSTPVVGKSLQFNNLQRGKVVEKEVKIHERNRIKPEVLQKFMAQYNYQFKFVVQEGKDLTEILELKNELQISPSKIYLMPEGISREQLANKRPWIIEECIKNGFNYTDRLHIIAYGDKREA